MATDCPFCGQPNADRVMVCSSCGRDIGVPESLVAEREALLHKRSEIREELTRVKAELERLRRNGSSIFRRS